MTYDFEKGLHTLDSHYPLTSRSAQNVPHYFGQRDVRCSMLWTDPAQRDRLVEIRDNLTARILEAKREGWPGEVEGLQISLTGAEGKLAQLDRRSHHKTAVDLGIPATPSNR